MTRELNQLLKKLKALKADDIARVRQFIEQLECEHRGLPVELKAIQGDGRPMLEKSAVMAEVRAGALEEAAALNDAAVEEQARPRSPEAEVAQAACAQWRRRPFQAIDADDLQPIAALFREAVDTRAATRFRFGSR